jgi:hypothetical protein
MEGIFFDGLQRRLLEDVLQLGWVVFRSNDY